MNLAKECKIVQAITPTAGAAGTTDIEGATLDTQGYEGVLMEITFGAITSGAVTGITAQQGAASDLSDATNLADTGQVIADSDDGKVFFIDLYRPKERYVRLHVDRATQNAVVASATYILYGGPRKSPTPAHGTGVAGETHVSPAEGTA